MLTDDLTTGTAATGGAPPDRLARHLDNCNNILLPGDLLPLSLRNSPIGFVAPALASDPLLDGLIAVADGSASFADPAARGPASPPPAPSRPLGMRDAA